MQSEQQALPSYLNPSWLDVTKSYCHPNWQTIGDCLYADRSEDELQELYTHLGRLWMNQLKEEFGHEHQLMESSRFFLVSQASENQCKAALAYLEKCLHKINRLLQFLPNNRGYGKWPVLCLNDQTFYAYLSDYQVQDEEFASVGGVFLSKGYGHFAMPGGQLDRYYSVLAHELCHAQLATLQLPGWLDEAVTMIVEENLNGTPSYFLNREMIRRHRAYWSPAKLQDFWAGTTFWSPDDGQELSYHLSRFLFNALFQGGTVDPNNISHFILAAQRQDAGLTAAKEMLDIDLSEVVSSLLGEGDWSPDLEKISATKVQLEAPNAP